MARARFEEARVGYCFVPGASVSGERLRSLLGTRCESLGQAEITAARDELRAPPPPMSRYRNAR
jgi:hypothetical protein